MTPREEEQRENTVQRDRMREIMFGVLDDIHSYAPELPQIFDRKVEMPVELYTDEQHELWEIFTAQNTLVWDEYWGSEGNMTEEDRDARLTALHFEYEVRIGLAGI